MYASLINFWFTFHDSDWLKDDESRNLIEKIQMQQAFFFGGGGGGGCPALF